MIIVYVLAAAVIILIIATYLRKYLKRNEKIERKDDETIAKEEVESMIVTEKRVDKEEKDDKND